MENMENTDNKKSEIVSGVKLPTELEFTGLFYKTLARRPLIDVTTEKGEGEYWEKSYKRCNDITMYSWRNDWIENTKLNLKHFGHFNRDHSIKVFANELIEKPVILLGAGSSLQNNIQYLKLAKEKGIPIFTSHHSLMYLADIGVIPDFVCVLDAGKTWTDYWSFGKLDLKNVPLLTEQTCNHEQLKQYPGPVTFFKSGSPQNSVVGDLVHMELDRIVDPNKCGSNVEVGGHVLGAMTSIVRGVMRADTLIYVGCDYSFNAEGKFYPFDKKIDQEVPAEHFGGKEGEKLPAAPPPQGSIVDIFGNTVYSNGAYLGFKNVMDVAIRVNAIDGLQKNDTVEFINASEGGALGALIGGNSKWMKYKRLEDAIHYSVAKLEYLANQKAKAKEGG